jgi:hypothetical protein
MRVCAYVLVLLAVSSQALAGFIPVGVQNDVPLATVTDTWGWTLLYRGDYSVDRVDLAPILAGAGEYLMLGAIEDGSSTIELLAAALTTDVTTYTPRDVTHAANGAEWYYNAGSMGFAGLGDTIIQGAADLNGMSERDRLSWHTSAGGGFIGEYTAAPTDIRFGWRAGSYIWLNGDPTWDKLIFTTDTTVIPEPATLSLLGLGLLVAARRRRKR